MLYEGNIRMRRNGLKRTETLNFKILNRIHYIRLSFFLKSIEKILMRLKATSFPCNAIDNINQAFLESLENFKSCLALWPMRLRLYSIPTLKTKIFGFGANKTKSP